MSLPCSNPFPQLQLYLDLEAALGAEDCKFQVGKATLKAGKRSPASIPSIAFSSILGATGAADRTLSLPIPLVILSYLGSSYLESFFLLDLEALGGAGAEVLDISSGCWNIDPAR